MADKPKNTTPKPIFDVSHPSKTKALATSKPVLVANRTIIKDPMMSNGPEPATDMNPEPARVLDKVTITPLSAPALPKTTSSKAETAAEPEAADEPVSPEEEPEAAADNEEKANEAESEEEPEAADEKQAKEEDADADSEEEAPKTKAGEPSLDLEKAAEEQAREEAEIQKLIDSKKYFLSIETTENRKAKRFIALGVLLSLILAAAWFDVALDAGLVHIGNLKALTHFFSN